MEKLQEERFKYKLAPSLQKKIAALDQKSQIPYSFTVKVTNIAYFKTFISREGLQVTILEGFYPANILQIKTTLDILFNDILREEFVEFIDIADKSPVEELALNSLDLSLNKISLTHDRYPLINGNDLTVSVKENRFDTSDIDFKGRYIINELASDQVNTHASIMSTIILGGGNTHRNSSGVALGASLTSSNFANLLPDSPSSYEALGISLQNHSYGVGIENYYGNEALAFDVLAQNLPHLVQVFSAGNDGLIASNQGLYEGIETYANLTGTFKMAKNIITVGAVDSFGMVALASSKGPAYDGRVKPELVAFGEEGSSGSAALVSGAVLLLQDLFQSQNDGQLPDAALIKAVLLNTADDIGPKGIDYQSGYGSLNAFKAMQILKQEQLITSEINSNEVLEFELFVPENVENLKITLVWNDPPAAINAEMALVNDLDIQVFIPNSEEGILPWVLNDSPHPDSLALPAKRAVDSKNNVEQFSRENISSGTYKIVIKANGILLSPQAFYIAYSWDKMQQFEWVSPSKGSRITSNEKKIIRWVNTKVDESADLSFKWVEDEEWTLLDETLDLSPNYYYWQSPDTFALAQLKASFSDTAILTDTFLISPEISLNVGFNCPDSLLLTWNTIVDADHYMVYELGDKYLEPIEAIADTFAILDRSNKTNLHYAVAPVHKSGRIGPKSFTLNIENQGVGCYIKNFLADLTTENKARLRLALGSTYQMESIVFEKRKGDQFLSVGNLIPLEQQLNYELLDDNMTAGINYYRVKIELMDGRFIYSNEAALFFLDGQDYWLYPNPTNTESGLTILSKEADELIFHLYNSQAQLVYKNNLDGIVDQLNLPDLPIGIYYYQIYKEKDRAHSGILFIKS